MQIKKLLLAAVIPFALLGCPEASKPDPAAAASAKPAASVVPAAAGSAAPAKSAGGW
jgi:hypothetical protein